MCEGTYRVGSVTKNESQSLDPVQLSTCHLNFSPEKGKSSMQDLVLFTAVALKSILCCDVMTSGLLHSYRHLGRSSHFIFTVTVYQTIRT
jgi:hypothetical protein